jgi:hypothetical protein
MREEDEKQKRREIMREIRNNKRGTECYLIAADPSEGRKEDEVVCVLKTQGFLGQKNKAKILPE